MFFYFSISIIAHTLFKSSTKNKTGQLFFFSLLSVVITIFFFFLLFVFKMSILVDIRKFTFPANEADWKCWWFKRWLVIKFLRNVYKYRFSWKFYFFRPKRKAVYFSTNIHTSHLWQEDKTKSLSHKQLFAYMLISIFAGNDCETLAPTLL